MEAAELTRVVCALAAACGIDPTGIRLELCATGGNNRVYRLHTDDRVLIAKHYFSHPSDPRDRLGAEFSFLEYAERLGIGCVPRPLACDRAAYIGLYEHIAGRKPRPGEIGAVEVREAARFFQALNTAEGRHAAATLPVASEACFSITGHLRLVEQRIERLTGIVPNSEVDVEAARFAQSIRLRWGALVSEVSTKAAAQGLDLEEPLPEEEQCVSPSDFGFHNALRRPSGRLTFLDFEYAGRDDPAKMVCDFFCQPAVPVPEAQFAPFVEATLARLRGAEAAEARARLLLAVYRMKWACIMLNHFVPGAAQRRRFADPGLDEPTRKRAQLERARRSLADLLA